MRVFVVKSFGKFQRQEGITDAALCDAVERAERGLIDANLSLGLIKQRVPRPGQGRRGGFRTIVAYRVGDRAVFLYGFPKNARDNIEADELRDLAKVGRAFLGANADALKRNVKDGRITEVDCASKA